MLFANLCEQQGDYKMASDYYQLSLKEDPRLIYASNNLAMVLVKLSSQPGEDKKKSLDDAEIQANNAIRNVDAFANLQPAEKEAVRLPLYDTLATVLSAQGKFTEAIAAIDRAIKSDPENPLWYLSKAEFCVAAKKEDMARDVLKQITSLRVDTNKWDPTLRRRYDEVVDSSRLK
jgi:tetratricopeptide (TPR) repeat protein